MNKTYTVSGLARLAGVSVRTLHHYDTIGLLRPRRRRGSGYREYGEEELLRLQQILLYRELEVPLDEVRTLMESPDFDLGAALRNHRRSLEEKARRLATLLTTIDRTLNRLEGSKASVVPERLAPDEAAEPRISAYGEGDCIMTDEELYEGFSKDEIASMKTEAHERWGQGPEYAESQKRVAKMTKEQWARVKAQGQSVETDCGEAMKRGVNPRSEEAMKLMVRKADWLRNFYEPTPDLFRGLGEMYVADSRFTATYEKIATGLAAWVKEAHAAFADRGLKLN